MDMRKFNFGIVTFEYRIGNTYNIFMLCIFFN
jgi:hypothetical protein